MRVALGHDVFGGQQEFLQRRAHAALQQHRLALLADGVEQIEILHVPRADLQHIGVVGDQFHLLDRHHFGDDRQPGLLARQGQQFQPFLGQSLEGIGIGARLERPAAQADRAGFLHGVGDFQQLRFALDAARPGDHADLLAADRSRRHRPARRDDRSLLLDLPRRHFVRGEDRHDFVDAVDGFQDRAVLEAVVADDRDHGSLGSDDDVFFESHFAHQVDDMLDLLLASSRVS